MGLDIIVLLGMIVPVLVLFGVSVLVMVLSHLFLTTSGCRFSTETSVTLGLMIFVLGELLGGFFQIPLTLFMLVLVTPFMVLEAVRPSGMNEQSAPVEVDIAGYLDMAHPDILCFSHNGTYVSLTGVEINGIPVENSAQRKASADEAELKQLLPLWEQSKGIASNFTVEARVVDGIVRLLLFVSVRDKNWKNSLDSALQSRQAAIVWLKQMDYSFSTLENGALKALTSDSQYGFDATIASPTVACHERLYFGVISADDLGTSFSANLGQVLEHLTETRTSARVLLSFASAAVPKLNSELSKFNRADDEQPRPPLRVEDHQLRDIYRQIAEVEACEETGAFRTGISIIVQGNDPHEVEANLKQVELMLKGYWGDAKTIVLTASRAIQKRSLYLLRSSIGRGAQMSGARLIGLLDMSPQLPGLSGHVLPPEFILPSFNPMSKDTIPLGHHLHQKRKTNQMYGIHKNAFTTHALIVGNPGSGKTNTALHLVIEFHKRNVPFLVINPAKTEWRQLGDRIPHLRIFTAGNESTTPFRFNFFDVPPGVAIHTHIDNITTCFIAAWPTEGILVEHITKIFRRVYVLAGWDILKNERGRPILLPDLYDAMEQVVAELGYGSKLNQDFVGALKARFESLLDDPILSVIFNIEDGLTIPDLLNHQTVLELRGFSENKVALITSLILVGVSEYIEAQDAENNQELKHLIVLEEAHHVLKRVDSGGGLQESHATQQQAINTIVHLLRESRGLGLGLILIDQLPSKLADAAVRLPGITIIHYLKEPQERISVGGQANLSDEQLNYVGALDCGEAIVHQGFQKHAVNITVKKTFGIVGNWDNQRVIELMKPFYNEHRSLKVQHIPVVDSWKPDPVVLWNLKYVVDSPEFIESFRQHAERGVEFHRLYLRRLVERTAESASSYDIDQYVSILLEQVGNDFGLEESLDEEI